MALSLQQQLANQFSAKVNSTSFLDRFAHDVGNTAKGFVPGLLEIGKTVAHDAGAAFRGQDFRSDDLAGGMWGGFRDQSFIPALATGQFGEAWSRFSDRPFSGMLDATLAAPAFKATTFAGSRLGTLESRGRFAELGGYQKLDPNAAGSVRGALAGISDGTDPSMFGNLPATMQIGGITQPTRNFFGLGKSDTMNIGDDLWARQVHRTINPTVKTDPIAMNLRDQLDNPEGVLDDDLSQTLMMPRSENELWAKAGDAAAPLFAKAFPGYVSRRWGKKLTRDTMRTGMVAGDQANFHYGKAIEDIDPVLERIAPDMTPEERYRALGLATLVNAHGRSVDEMSKVRDYYSPTAAQIPTELAEEMYDLPLYEFMQKTNTGFFPYDVSKDGSRSFLDPLTHPDTSLTVRQLMEKYGDELPNNFSYESVSPALKDALDKQMKARQDFFVSWDNALQDAQNNGYSWYVKGEGSERRPITREDLEADPNLIDNLDHNYIRAGAGDEFTADPQVIAETLEQLRNVRTVKDLNAVSNPIVATLMEKWRDHRRANPEGPSRAAVYVREQLRRMQQEGGIKGRMTELQKLARGLRDARYYSDTLKNKSAATLGINDLQRGLVTRMEGSVNPGIVNVLDEILDPESPMGPVVQQLMDTEEYGKWVEYKDAVTRKSREIEQERLDSRLLDDERASWNEQRLRRWMNDDTDGGTFFPMRYQRKEGPETVEVEKNPELRRSDEISEPGSPYEVYLSGQFDLDPNVHVRNLKRQNDLLTHDRLIGRIREMAVHIPDEELARNKKLVTKEADLGSNSRAGQYVLLDSDGPLNADIRKIRNDLESLAYDIRVQGGDNAAEDLLDLIDDLDLQANGDVRNLAIPTEAYKAIKNEISTGVEALGKFYEAYREVGDWWKFTVLHARFPSWFRNNWIGAQLMLLMSGGATKMPGAYANSLKWADPKKHEFLGEAFPEARSLGSAQQARGLKLMRMIQPDGPFAAQREKLLGVLNKLSDINANYADSPARLARVSQILDERVSQLVQLGKQNGIDIQDTPELRQRMVEHEPTRHGIAQEMLRDMVDFSDLGRREREWLVAILPFWSWMKGSAKALARLESDHPERVWAMEQVADVGERESIADAGQAAPDFARGWYNIFGDQWMSTGGWNPYEAPMDLATMGMGFVPGGMSYRQFGTENLFGNMNPVISGGAASVLGKDPFFGTPMANDNPMDTFLKMQLRNPIATTLMLPWQKQGPTATTNKTIPGSLANLMGVPTVDPRWGMVWSRGVDEAQERFQNPAVLRQLNAQAQGIS